MPTEKKHDYIRPRLKKPSLDLVILSDYQPTSDKQAVRLQNNGGIRCIKIYREYHSAERALNKIKKASSFSTRH